MSEPTFVPGPWILDAPSHGDVIEDHYHFIDAGAGYVGGDEPGFGIQGCLSLADARLIASAPDLLEALRGYMDAVEVLADARINGINAQGALSDFVGWTDRAKDAINKALGREGETDNKGEGDER